MNNASKGLICAAYEASASHELQTMSSLDGFNRQYAIDNQAVGQMMFLGTPPTGP